MSAPAATAVRALLGRAEYLAAFDAAESALAGAPGEPELEYLALLALARAGATDTAAARLAQSSLVERADEFPRGFAEDVCALTARLAKDRALRAAPDDRARLAATAADLYAEAATRFEGTYSGINAATMARLAGDASRARELATQVLARLGDDSDRDADYWTAVTRAEALLLLEDITGVAASLSAAARLGGDISERASTRRQLAMLCEAIGVDRAVLDALPVPVALHFCGLLGTDERDVGGEVRAALDRVGPVIAHGSLAAGADILIAEAILEQGGALNVVLPFPVDEFVETSVTPGGAHWLDRFRSCLDRAASVTIVTAGRQGDDDAAYAYCSSIAMGSALIRARFMAGRAVQIALWDGAPSLRIAGTSADVARWAESGSHSIVIPVQRHGTATPARHRPGPSRTVEAILFADVKGFSALADSMVPTFVSDVLGPLAAVLDGVDVRQRNGWGDALFVVLDSVTVAADVALRMQEVMAGLDLERLTLPSLSLRIGVHAGPVFSLHDPVRAVTSFFGEHVNRAARIEPITPPGAVFVTGACAALLALDAHCAFACEYVGRVATAKSYGEFPMYLLRRDPARRVATW